MSNSCHKFTTVSQLYLVWGSFCKVLLYVLSVPSRKAVNDLRTVAFANRVMRFILTNLFIVVIEETFEVRAYIPRCMRDVSLRRSRELRCVVMYSSNR